MVSMLRVEGRWSGKTCELDFVARRRFQGRKGEIGRKDSASVFLERESVTGLRRKKMA
jgi:hypothetical protein